MLVSTFDEFVRSTDQSVAKPHDERVDIAIYGLTAEIGSVVAAVKKRLLAEDGDQIWNSPNVEIVEELGDVMWYCFALASLNRKPLNIFSHDIANLKKEIGATNERAARIKSVLDPSKREEFLSAAKTFPKSTRKMEFESYQKIAFLTARTENRTLVEVCLAVLLQLGAQLFRRKLPEIELELNKAIADRKPNDLLGEIAWHISALASIFGTSLSHIAQQNIDKVSFRLDRTHPTPLHDESELTSQKFPRQFEVAFISIGIGRSRMYLDGQRFGNDLSDNSYINDGYRFHDIMHLANVAKLGWSPVLRGLMGRKRKRDPILDEVEDGARAQIVEEALIKSIHSEGQSIAGLFGPSQPGAPQRLFARKSDITFRFLKFIRNLVADLEVHKNKYWEWEDAILAGYEIFQKLHAEGQGTVYVDIDKREVRFRPEVFFDFAGQVAGLGSAYEPDAPISAATDGTENALATVPQRERVLKRAILDALDIFLLNDDQLSEIDIVESSRKGVSVKARKTVQEAMWSRKVVTFKTSIRSSETGGIYCTAIAIADV